MRSKLKVFACLVGVLAPGLLAVPGPAAADEVFKATSIINVPIVTGVNTKAGLNSFDISFDDEALRIYLLADRSNAGIDIVDPNNNSIGVLAAGGFQGVKASNLSGPNGVLTVRHRHHNNEAWGGDGNSTLKVVDISTGAVIQSIATGGTQRTDEGCWDPVDHVVLFANDEDASTGFTADLFITFVSTKTYGILGQIEFRDGADKNSMGVQALNGIEQCKWNPRTGKFYLNIPQMQGTGAVRGSDNTPGAVLEIDPVSRKVTRIFPINFGFVAGTSSAVATGDCLGNQGMAIGADHQILLGCSNAGAGSVIIDERDGHLIANLPGENGNDEVWYNPGDNQYFLAESKNQNPQSRTVPPSTTVNPVVGVVDGDGSNDANAEGPAGSVTASGMGSHSVAADPFRGQVFVPINNVAGAAGGQASKICSSLGGNDAQGCIAVYTSQGRDDKCLASGGAVVAFEDGDPQLLRVLCHDNDRDHDGDHDHDH
jgi:hypothetical protein